MYASAWFLTLCASVFPLNAAFRIMDVFICEVREVMGNCSFVFSLYCTWHRQGPSQSSIFQIVQRKSYIRFCQRHPPPKQKSNNNSQPNFCAQSYRSVLIISCIRLKVILLLCKMKHCHSSNSLSNIRKKKIIQLKTKIASWINFIFSISHLPQNLSRCCLQHREVCISSWITDYWLGQTFHWTD